MKYHYIAVNELGGFPAATVFVKRLLGYYACLKTSTAMAVGKGWEGEGRKKFTNHCRFVTFALYSRITFVLINTTRPTNCLLIRVSPRI